MRRGVPAPKAQLPDLTDDIRPEAAAGFCPGAREAGALVEAACRAQILMRPQRDALVARSFCKAHALGDEARAESHAACGRLDQQQPQFRAGALAGNEKDAPQAPAVALCNPAALARRVELLDELRGDARHQRLEVLVPAELLCVKRAVPLDDPPQIAGAKAAQRELGIRGYVPEGERLPQSAHRVEDVLTIRAIERRQQPPHLLLAAPLEWGKHPLACGGELQMLAAAILARRRPLQQAARLKALENAAQVTTIETELAGELCGRDSRSVRDFVQHAHLGQRIGAVEEAAGEHAELAGVVAVEGADLRDLRGADGAGHGATLARIVASVNCLAGARVGGPAGDRSLRSAAPFCARIRPARLKAEPVASHPRNAPMPTPRALLPLLILLAPLSSLPATAATKETEPPAAPRGPIAQAAENAVVKVFATLRRPDVTRPWAKSAATEVSGSGVVIEGKRILTNAHVVTYASQIQVEGSQSGDKVPATLEAIAPGIDLAVLKLEDESFFSNRSPLPRASKLPQIKDAVFAYGFPTGGTTLSITRGIVSRIEFVGYSYLNSGLRI